MLFGDVTRSDCQNTSQAQGLPLLLYRMACDHDNEDLAGNPDAALPLIELRSRETEILNSKLRSRSDGRRTSYGTDSIVILDCPSAYGGICVLNDIGDSRYIRIDKFINSTMADEILYQSAYFLDAQVPSATTLASTFARQPLNEDVLAVAQEIKRLRFFYDHPEIKEYISQIVLDGARILINLMKFFLMNR